MISDELREEFASGILINDVATYVASHQKEYKKWLTKNSKNKPSDIQKQKPKATTQKEVLKKCNS